MDKTWLVAKETYRREVKIGHFIDDFRTISCIIDFFFLWDEFIFSFRQ